MIKKIPGFKHCVKDLGFVCKDGFVDGIHVHTTNDPEVCKKNKPGLKISQNGKILATLYQPQNITGKI